MVRPLLPLLAAARFNVLAKGWSMKQFAAFRAERFTALPTGIGGSRLRSSYQSGVR